jgi:hypothetical protein
MPANESAPAGLDEFLTRWEASGGAERANYQLFLSELCDVIGVPRPEPTRIDDAENAYVFERAVTFPNPDGSTSGGRIDLYKRGCFILEAKQGSDRADASDLLASPKRTRRGTAVRGTGGWDNAMLDARGQADRYVRALPSSEPNPPFILVVDVGHTIEVYSDFTRQGRTYIPFPDPLTHRIRFRDLGRPDVRERLRLVWTDPLELDPSRRSAKVTKDVADRLAKLAKSLEASGHPAELVAQFLMRCLFTFFAEDVGLLPKDGFTNMLRDLHERRKVSVFREKTRSLWETMKTGGFSPILDTHVYHFNGGLFESADALDLTADQLALMVEAGEMQWRDVEPAIFGTLVERALNPVERHKLGAHYTPRAYVERLVMPTIIDPLREQWSNILAAAVTIVKEADDEYERAATSREVKSDRVALSKRDAALREARSLVHGFLKTLCSTIVLDPACGTGNFLYVTMEHMKRLEGEVWDVLKQLGETQTFEGFGMTVDPHQFLGIEINPRAAAIADLVLWIGYLQWHFRTYGDKIPPEPIIRAYHNIECRDALLVYDGTEPLRDEHGNPVTRWDGRTMKRHPVTGEDVPDETIRTPVLSYINPKPAGWPKSDFVVGNPPFIGGWKMRSALGEGYTETLWRIYPHLPQKADYVIYWWDKAAKILVGGDIRKFGFITTNSVTQLFQRRVLQSHVDHGLSLLFAIPDHPWVDSENGAAVRVAMTVAERGAVEGKLLTFSRESFGEDDAAILDFQEQTGTINADLTIGATVLEAVPLRANENIISAGVQLYGDGFIVSSERANSWGQAAEAARRANVLRRYINGRDLMQNTRNVEVIDFFGFEENAARKDHPVLFQHLLDYVKPERDHNSRESIRRIWWRFGWERPVLRKQIQGLMRFIVTTETAKHRVFVFLDSSILPDNMITAIALDDAFPLGLLSSRIHVRWSLSAGGRLGVGNDPRYTKARCFDPFPSPICDNCQKAVIRELGEQLDAHRKARQAEHPTLTLTGMYNVLAKLRSGEALTDKERVIHEQGLVSVLKQIHDDLDAAVFDAYGWPHDLTDDEILVRLVALNRERAEEEKSGLIRWLRPEFQNPGGPKPPAARQSSLLADEPEAVAAPATPTKKQPWPKTLPEQAQAVRALFSASPSALTPAAIAKTFQRGQPARVAELLDTLVSLGHARDVGDGTYVRS